MNNRASPEGGVFATATDDVHRECLDMATAVACAYLSGNTMPATAVPDFISHIYLTYSSLNGRGGLALAAMESPTKAKPAVPIKKSVAPDYIVCLEDGKQFKSLKRHLRASYDLSPEEYRAKWGLPPDYPMVAPNYAAQRSEMAKKLGLGTLRKAA